MGNGSQLNGLDLLDAGSSLSSFNNYMESIASSLPFVYDTAVAFYK